MNIYISQSFPIIELYKCQMYKYPHFPIRVTQHTIYAISQSPEIVRRQSSCQREANIRKTAHITHPIATTFNGSNL